MTTNKNNANSKGLIPKSTNKEYIMSLFKQNFDFMPPTLDLFGAIHKSTNEEYIMSLFKKNFDFMPPTLDLFGAGVTICISETPIQGMGVIYHATVQEQPTIGLLDTGQICQSSHNIFQIPASKTKIIKITYKHRHNS